MDPSVQLAPYFKSLRESSHWKWSGRVTRATGFMVESDGPFCSVGECCTIVNSDGREFAGEVVGFRGSTVLSMPLERLRGIRYGDRIVAWGARPSLRVGDELLGRVIDATGRPLDSLPAPRLRSSVPLQRNGPPPLDRQPMHEPLSCGVRAIDAFITCALGQRVGIFGGSGVGKSTLIGIMTRESAADLVVLALVGERGREVREFLTDAIGEEGLRHSVIIVSTSDQSPLLRIRAALAATSVAEYFCSEGKNVLLVVDSLTRLAMAQREIGLAAGEPPTAKGYTPSVFTLMAQFIERAGKFNGGSITGFYTVLMEGDDQQDPLVDAVRSLLDGHIVLDRRLAAQGHYPPISILDSLSRLMPGVCQPLHLEKTRQIRGLLSTYANAEDLVRVGAYQRGSDPMLDKAIGAIPAFNRFLQQKPTEKTGIQQTVEQLLALPS